MMAAGFHRTPLQVLFFTFLVMTVAFGTGFVLRNPTLAFLRPVLLEASVYGILILALAYGFFPPIFSKRHWHIPRGSMKWMAFVIALQIVAVQSLSRSISPNLYFAVGALVVAPLVEEVVRAVTICALVDSWGPFWAIAATSIVSALMHPDPLRTIAPQIALSILFVITDQSVVSCVVAHSIANVIAIWAGGPLF